MKTKPMTKGSRWDVRFWLAVSSPLPSVLLAILALAVFSGDQEGMSITPIVFILVIELFGFDDRHRRPSSI